MSFTTVLLDRTKQLSTQVSLIKFTFDGFIYNPLDYAWETHSLYLSRYVREGANVMFLGMNPGPFGMMQTGVPFGEIKAVREYLKISGNVSKPAQEHPARPVLGFDCKRSEISGKRLWGLVSEIYQNPDDFASQNCVFNYCPLGFLEKGKTAKNFTPDHLPREERKALENLCDSYLFDVVELIKPKYLIGVGKYAMEKFQKTFPAGYEINCIIHPSPGNPQANDNWNGKTLAKLKDLGIWK